MPLADRTIRFGTITEYRKTENKFVQDREEGTFDITLKFANPTLVTRDFIRRVTCGSYILFEGQANANFRTNQFNGRSTVGAVHSVDNIAVRHIDSESAFVEGSIDVRFESADAYLLCMSEKSEIGSVIMDPEYDSVWSLQTGMVNQFLQQLFEAESFAPFLTSMFSNETVGPLQMPGFAPPPRSADFYFDLTWEVGEVEYRSRSIEIEEMSEDVIRQVHHCLDRSSFIKPIDFEREREVRILIRPVQIDRRNGARHLFPNYLKPLLLPFEPILNLAMPVNEP